MVNSLVSKDHGCTGTVDNSACVHFERGQELEMIGMEASRMVVGDGFDSLVFASCICTFYFGTRF